MKKTARSMFVFTMVFALFLTCTAVYAIDDETAAVTTLYTSEEVSYYQALLTDFYTNNSRSNYSIYYDANDTRALNNTAFMNATNHLYVNNDWHSIITYIRDNDLLIYKISIRPKEGIGELSPNALHTTDVYECNFDVHGTTYSTSGIESSISYLALATADIHYVTETSWIINVTNCEIKFLNTLPWHEHAYDDSYVDWDLEDESTVEITVVLDFGVTVISWSNDEDDPIMYVLNHDYHVEHDFTIDMRLVA